MNGPDVIGMYCTRFQQILVGERGKNLKHEISIEDKAIKKKYGNFSIRFFIKNAGKWQKCNLVSGMASVASSVGWL